MNTFPKFAAAVSLALFTALAAGAATKPTAVRKPDEDVNSAAVRTRQSLGANKDLLFNGWGVSPAGQHVSCGDLALKIVIAPDKKAALAVCAGYNHQGVNVVSLDAKRESQFIKAPQAFNGLVFSRDGKKFYVSGGDSGVIYIFNYANGKASLDREVKPDAGAAHVFLAGLAVHPGTGALYVCNEGGHEIWLLDPATLKREQTIAVGQHPHSCAIGGDEKHLYVSNWGSRSVSVIDMKKGVRLRDITVGIRPNDLALAPDGRLFVACSGDNTVHVIGTGKLEKAGPDASPARPLWAGTREIISTSLYPQSPEGSTPCSVAVSADGKTLFVANADNNAVMVVDISGNLMEEAKDHGEKIALVNGFIPTGWYPSAVCPTPDGQFLLVANGKGLTSSPSAPAKSDHPTKLHTGILHDHPGKTFEGSLSFVAKPDAKQMAAYTEQVRRNSPYHPEQFVKSPLPSDTVIPAKVGDPCPIKYVLYIIKENRTYDQVMSDMTDAKGRPIGNGDTNLLMYGEPVTPNQHQLARDYVLLDNLYCNSEVSVDGHSWTDAAIATDFNQRSWIMSYSKHGKVPGNEEMETPANGYLWDLCKRNGVTYKNYGEGSQRVPSVNRGKWPLDFQERDMDRVKIWIEDLTKAEQTGVLPRFTIMSLGENHTKGTSAGANTPEACVGSNDLGLGRIVEAASKSKFWKEMAIFVIEDDAQNGPDHVDAHRTCGYVISPYVKRGVVDSTLYTMASMIRTMELILGLPPLTQYDAGATPMFNCFTKKAIATEYTALMPKIDLNAKNTTKTAYAKESGRMNFKAYDLAPEDELNRILWAVARPGEAYPTPIHRALFTKPVE
ncbi:MAG: bifunctional YncE family protein/alkaline phosphatase family protein [Verrucomicrobia bacterium]|nr:bifunctional YncE family protein/alkaline phosphatase family protein [Verrucomicrobiota bacterium]